MSGGGAKRVVGRFFKACAGLDLKTSLAPVISTTFMGALYAGVCL